jgi:endosialidase-like protein
MAMAEPEKNLESALEGLDEQRRETLKRLIRGSAFVGPVVASFAMQNIAIRPAHAASSSLANKTTSDMRLKRDVVRLGTHANGCGIYSFRYLWSDTKYVGAIAQDVLEHVPDGVLAGPGGFLAVDYAALGMAMRAADAKAT